MSEKGTVAADDRSYLYGDGLFETLRVREDGSIRWLDAHIERLRRSGDALGFESTSIEAGVEALRSLSAKKAGIWRVTVSRGRGDASGQEIPFGGSGTVRLRFRPYHEPQRPNLGLARGFYLPNNRFAEHKSTSYLRSVEARRRAMGQGFEDAIMTSPGGLVGESSCANVIVVRQSRAATPPICGVLPGVTRAGILRRAEALGEAIEVRDIGVDELRAADEIVLLSAGVGLVSAASFLGRPLSDSWGCKAQGWLP